MIMMGDKKKMLQLVLGPHKEAGEKEEEGPEILLSLAQELIEAVHNHDAEALAETLKVMFQELEEMPHVEGEHIEE